MDIKSRIWQQKWQLEHLNVSNYYSSDPMISTTYGENGIFLFSLNQLRPKLHSKFYERNPEMWESPNLGKKPYWIFQFSWTTLCQRTRQKAATQLFFPPLCFLSGAILYIYGARYFRGGNGRSTPDFLGPEKTLTSFRGEKCNKKPSNNYSCAELYATKKQEKGGERTISWATKKVNKQTTKDSTFLPLLARTSLILWDS